MDRRSIGHLSRGVWLLLPLASLAAFAVVLQAPLYEPLPRLPLPKPAASARAVTINTNRTPSGVQRDRVLTLAMDVISARWKPEGDNDPEVPILAFAESGKAPSNPGPLIRVRVGTALAITITNRSDSVLVMHGVRAGSDAPRDTMEIAVGATRTVRYTLNKTGTYAYWAGFKGLSQGDRSWLDSQLNGVIVVDEPNARTDDHIFLISEWFLGYDDRRQVFEDVLVMNGKAFPHTQRLTLQQNDSVRFRVVNVTSIPHPMHLHGFYYRIEEVDGVRVPPSKQLLSNTDLLLEGSSEVLSFVPTTPGNWLFHCHFAFHVNEETSLTGSPRDSAEMNAQIAAQRAARSMPAGMAHAAGDAMSTHTMRGLVVLLQVTPAAGYAAPSMANARTIHLNVQRDPHSLPGGRDAFGFIEQKGDSAVKPNAISLPGPVLELVRGKPVRIVVSNHLEQPTSVHWHGLEIESFPDGVPNWSGMGSKVYTQIAPRDSFVAEFVPPRAGTFPYHSHFNDREQMISGMYGAIIVTDHPRDTTHDHVVVVGGGGPPVEHKSASLYALVNGSQSPKALHMFVGETHRLRIVSIHPDWPLRFTLRNDSTVAHWRAVAKDGADLPRTLATMRLARVVMGPGETSDFEFTPPAAGRWQLHVSNSESSGWQIVLPIKVEARPKAKAAVSRPR